MYFRRNEISGIEVKNLRKKKRDLEIPKTSAYNKIQDSRYDIENYIH